MVQVSTGQNDNPSPSTWNPSDPNDFIGIFDWPILDYIQVLCQCIRSDGVGNHQNIDSIECLMTSYDLEAETVSGIATPDSQIQVCVNFPDHLPAISYQQMVLEIGLRIIKIRRKGKQQISNRERWLGL